MPFLSQIENNPPAKQTPDEEVTTTVGRPIPEEVTEAPKSRWSNKYIFTLLGLLLIPISGTAAWATLGPKITPPNPSYRVPTVSFLSAEEVQSLMASASASQATDSAEYLEEDSAETEELVTASEPAVPEATPAPTPAVVTTSKALGFTPNKFGIHLFAGPDQIELAAELVNSNGGDWGWATMTFPLANRNTAWWNEIFAKAREKHIIPIIQLSNNGAIPSEAEISQAADFLASLGWPTKIRVISAFNEVNADEYWGGKADPDAFKSRSPEFFVLNGPFNASARTVCVRTDLGVDTCYISEEVFLQRMNQAVPGIFTKLDGWASHCYPHPGYRGHPLTTRVSGEADWEAGRNTMSSYKWELGLLRQYFGVSLPVFITETGWPHLEGTTEHPEWHPALTVAEYYKIVYRDLWGPDSRVVAATPFILKYDSYDNFSFIGADNGRFPQWEAIKSLPKTAANPPTN